MRRIIINEQDITSNEAQNLGNDVVYVPGFAVGGSQPARSPKLCTSVSEFENAFGSQAPTFLVDQVYPLKPATGAGKGFPAVAIPNSSGEQRIWYNQGGKDPSYVYAKELIRNGLSVVYERINQVTTMPSFAGNITLYSTTAGYAKDSYVVYNGAYYTNEAAIEEPAGAWDSTKWTAIPETSDDPEVVTAQWYDVTVDRMYDAMLGINLASEEHSIYDDAVPGSLSEISSFNIKYITSGGYPTFEFGYTSGSGQSITTTLAAQKLATLAYARGDAIAFIDHTDNPDRPLTGTDSVYSVISNGYLSSNTDSYSAMITPWGIYNTTESSDIPLAGSFGYLIALARALRTYPTWLPVAGVVRGIIPSLKSLHTTNTLTNAIADSYQLDPTSSDAVSSINAITYINGRGYTLWGNRTLSNVSNGFATIFLNMRNLICDVKKQAFTAAQQCMFEQNTDVLWVNFKNNVQKLLDQMVAGSAVDRYKIVKVATNDKTKIAAHIQIVPIYAVESFEISVIMTDEEIIVE